MIKLVCFLKRHPDLTREEFLHHWRHRHGPLITATPSVARHVVRYEQLLPTEALPYMAPEGYDGITVMWFRAAADFEAFIAEPDYAAVIAPDERTFLDLDGLVGMLTEEPIVVIDGAAT